MGNPFGDDACLQNLHSHILKRVLTRDSHTQPKDRANNVRKATIEQSNVYFLDAVGPMVPLGPAHATPLPPGPLLPAKCDLRHTHYGSVVMVLGSFHIFN